MFGEMPVIASRGLVKVLFNLFIWHHCFPILLVILSYHSILGSDLGSGPKKVAKILGSLAQNWQFWSTFAGRQAYERNFMLLAAPLPIELE